MKYTVLFLLLFFTLTAVYAQPANDDYGNAITLTDLSKCSSDAFYSNINATDENFFGSPTQWANETGRDVWFKFTAGAYDVNITVTGNSTGGGTTGGTLQNPLIALYTIENNGTSFSVQVGTLSAGPGISTYYKGALIVGKVYYIRVSARSNNTGTFKLCIDNYFPPVKAGQDCNTAATLCDKRTFTQSNVSGTGNSNTESAGSCLGRESNSVWYKWTAANNGTLTMDITPTVNQDDIDWVLYDLGLADNCDNKTLIRCASGHGVDNRDCPNDPRYFKTGMDLTSTEISEESGCGRGGQNGYIKYIDMQQGHTYALLVDNFSNGNNGFKIEFGGTGEFVGPQAKIDLTKNKPCTIDQNFTFNNTGSTGYSRLLWTFGEGATPASSTNPGPQTISYSTPGFKTAVLQLFNEDDCSVVTTQSFMVGLKPDIPVINGIKARYCIGEAISLSTPRHNDAIYSWTGPGGFTSDQPEISIPVDNINKAGIYYLTVTINECTSDPASVTVPPIGQTPVASFTSTIANPCTIQQTYTFTNGSVNYQKIRWNFGDGANVQPGAGNQVYTVSYATSGIKTIILEAEGNSGCISTFNQTITVSISPAQPVISVNKPDFCLTDTIKLSTPAQPNVSYQWTGPANFTSDQRSVEILVTGTAVAGTYSLIVSRGQCSTQAVSVIVPPIYKNPIAAFRAEPKIPAKLSFPIKVRFFNESQDADAYLWDFGDGATSTDENPEHTYLSAGNFDVTLTVFKSSVCSTSVVQGKLMISADNILFIPNTFTPNNDAVNDEFVVNMTNIKIYRIQIFNRFGTPLFISDDIFDNWKGTYKNEPLPVGTYYYIVEASDFNENIIRKSGSVTILR